VAWLRNVFTRQCRRDISRASLIVAGAALTGGVLAASHAVLTPNVRPTRVAHIGFLADSAGPTIFSDGFRTGLSQLGYVDGENITVEWRFADGDDRKLTDFAAELVALKVDIAVGAGTQACLALQQATTSLPIVMGNSSDPVGEGLVQSLAHPGANITGVSAIGPQLARKRLEALVELVPSTKCVAVLWNPDDPPRQTEYRELRSAADRLGLNLFSLPVHSRSDLAGAIGAARGWQADGLLVLEDPLTHSNIAQLVASIGQAGLPSGHNTRPYAEAGGLFSYGADLVDVYRRSAIYVDKILKGARPADLPVEQATTFDFVINLQTARSLGLTIPQSVLRQATAVIP
jgi:putative ABC transport system substrate-binding protein